MNRDAYQLLWDTDHLLTHDDQYDLAVERPEALEGVPQYWPTVQEEVTLPEPLLLAANFGNVRYTDYPSNPLGWPILSRRMLSVLLGIRAFPHRAVPVRIVDPIVSTQAEHERADALLGERITVADDDYVAVQLTSLVDLDEAASGVVRDPDLPWMVEVERYVFPMGTILPPLFRLSTDASPLYVSAEARAALKAAGVRGPRYLPLEGYVDGGGDEVDVPVPVPVVED